MLATTLAFQDVNGIVRHLGTELPAAQTAFIRFALGLLFPAPAPWAMRGLPLAPGIRPLVWWRGALDVAAVIFWFGAMARVFRAAPLAVTQPVAFLQIVRAAPLGATVFGEAVDAFVILGGALIVGAVSLNTRAEARKGRIPPQPEPWGAAQFRCGAPPTPIPSPRGGGEAQGRGCCAPGDSGARGGQTGLRKLS